jgi:hypothetical protein
MAGMYKEIREAREPLLGDAIIEAELVEKEARWFYRDFTGISFYYVESEKLNAI